MSLTAIIIRRSTTREPDDQMITVEVPSEDAWNAFAMVFPEYVCLGLGEIPKTRDPKMSWMEFLRSINIHRWEEVQDDFFNVASEAAEMKDADAMLSLAVDRVEKALAVGFPYRITGQRSVPERYLNRFKQAQRKYLRGLVNDIRRARALRERWAKKDV